MPTYDYLCEHCGTEFSRVQSFHDAALSVCPNCGKVPRRLISAPGIVFKGSGWYKNDSRAAPKGEGPDKPATADKPASGATAEAGKSAEGAKPAADGAKPAAEGSKTEKARPAKPAESGSSKSETAPKASPKGEAAPRS